MTIRNEFFHDKAQLDSPVANADSVVPSDTEDMNFVTRAIYVGGSGNLRVTMLGGQELTFANVSAGWHPIRATRVHATGTTATSIVGAW